MLPDFFFRSLFSVQQTKSGTGHRVQLFFRVGNQYAECEKQQQTTTTTTPIGANSLERTTSSHKHNNFIQYN